MREGERDEARRETDSRYSLEKSSSAALLGCRPMSQALWGRAVLFLIAGAGVLVVTGCGGGDGSPSVPTGPLVDYSACFTGKEKALAEENEAAFRAGLHHPASVTKQPKGNLPTIEERFTGGVQLCSSRLLLRNKEAALKVESERCAEWKEDKHSVIEALAGQPAIDVEQRLVEYRVLCV